MHAPPEHPPPPRLHVVALERVVGVVVARRNVHGVHDDEAQRYSLLKFGGQVCDSKRQVQIFRTGVDEHESTAHVARHRCRFVEDLTKLVFHFLNVLQLRHSLCTVVTSGDVNPLSGDVVRHRLHARSDHAVLSNLLKSAVPDERGDGELPHFEGMLLEAVVNGRESPHRPTRTVESQALFDGRS